MIAYEIKAKVDGKTEVIYVAIGCPGCKSVHQLAVGGKCRYKWGWNGSLEKPTFTPSLLVNPSLPPGADGRCHSFITDGRIRFLGDCGHDLKNQTVDLLELGEDGWLP